MRGRGQGLTLNDKNAKMHFLNSKRQMEETSGHAEIEYPIHFKNSRHFYAKLTSLKEIFIRLIRFYIKIIYNNWNSIKYEIERI